MIPIDYGIVPLAEKEDIKFGSPRWRRYVRLWDLHEVEKDPVERFYQSRLINNVDWLLIIVVYCSFCGTESSMRGSDQVEVYDPKVSIARQRTRSGTTAWRCDSCSEKKGHHTTDGMVLSHLDQKNEEVIRLSDEAIQKQMAKEKQESEFWAYKASLFQDWI